MMPYAILCVLIIDAVLLGHVWGFKSDKVNGGRIHRASAALKASEYGRESEETMLIEAYRSKLQKMYLNHFTETSEEMHDELRNRVRDDEAKLDEILAESRVFEDGFEAQEEEEPVSISSWLEPTCVGDDCEECLIPDDFKAQPGSIEPVDVMDFLGIRRAEPLRKYRDWE